jgi:hypothetical protein
MKKFFLTGGLIISLFGYSFAQVGINSDNSTPAPSAGLDVKFSNKGFLLPRLSQSMIQSILNPTDGLQVYCTTDSKIYIYVATSQQWKEIAYGTGTILPPPFSCGIPITINHFAGVVAPVDKTVTYETVTNIPGELTKCWITSNLGSDHQATAVDDATEASAGWYWQFNRKQGYKHDGTTRMPNTIWITSINEDLNWQTANDPCNLELGAPWRIPTYTEWNNVDNVGGWNNWNGPWSSGLKLHAAGTLDYNDGSLSGRGVSGGCWGSTQHNTTNARYVGFWSGASAMYFDYKTYGYPLRCIRNP